MVVRVGAHRSKVTPLSVEAITGRTDISHEPYENRHVFYEEDDSPRLWYGIGDHHDALPKLQGHDSAPFDDT